VTQPTPWLTPEEVALYLDVPYPDPTGRVDGSTNAVIALVERRRSDLFTGGDSTAVPPVPAVFVPGDDVHEGAKLWAAQMFQTRNAPSGYAGYGDEATLFDALGARRAEILRLVGWRRPVIV